MDLGKNKIYIVGNWKMNPASQDDAEMMFDQIENEVYKINNDSVEVAVCMPCMFLSEFDPEGKIRLGAQNIFWEKQGAFTGEISAEMLRRAGAKYVIVGHSERRKYLLETDEMVNLKIKACLAESLRPILCVGETAEEKEKGDAGEVIVRQVEKALMGIPDREIRGKILIAYEPVWAISSGTNPVIPTTDEIMSMGLIIRKALMKLYGSREIVDDTPILYGGSVSCENCFDFVDKTGMKGLLIGSASLRPQEFAGIVRKFA